MDKAIQQYKRIKNPTNFVTNFQSMEEFKQWAEQGTIKDLYAAIEAFKECELYEYCAIMSNVIKSKQ